jgi:hypothetical protein
MTMVNSSSQTNTPVDVGSAVQFQFTNAELQFNTEIDAGDSTTSALLQNNGFNKFCVALIASQVGQIKCQRYLDTAGTIPQGDELLIDLVPTESTAINVDDGRPFQSLRFTVTNDSGSESELTANSILMLAQTF